MNDTTIVNLYFTPDSIDWDLVAKDVPFLEAWKLVTDTIEKRFPKLGRYFNCHLTEKGEEFIDFGHHTAFFKLAPAKKVSAPKNTPPPEEAPDLELPALFADFGYNFESFAKLLHDTSLKGKVCRFFDDEGCAVRKIIIGSTAVPNDVLLHMIDADDIETKKDFINDVNQYGIELHLLSKILNEYGCCISPSDQIFSSLPKPQTFISTSHPTFLQ